MNRFREILKIFVGIFIMFWITIVFIILNIKIFGSLSCVTMPLGVVGVCYIVANIDNIIKFLNK